MGVLWPGEGGFGAGLLAVQRKDPPGPMPLAGHSTFLVVPITPKHTHTCTYSYAGYTCTHKCTHLCAHTSTSGTVTGNKSIPW